jgi:hypothetical protein
MPGIVPSRAADQGHAGDWHFRTLHPRKAVTAKGMFHTEEIRKASVRELREQIHDVHDFLSYHSGECTRTTGRVEFSVS